MAARDPGAPPAWAVAGGWGTTAALAIGTVAIGSVIAVAGHAWGVPRTDDWAFARIAFTLNRTGHFRLLGWAQMNLVGQVLWAQPWLWVFGNSYAVLDASVAALVAVGLAAAHRLARRVVGPGAPATVAVLGAALFPGFIRDAATFMTDAPGFALQALVLFAGAAALRAQSWRLLVLTAGLGFCAFSVREFTLAATLAVLAAWWLGSATNRRRTVALAAVFIVACAALYVWRSGLPGGQPYVGREPIRAMALVLVEAGFTVAFGLIPALVWSAPRWWKPVDHRLRLRGMTVGAAVAIVPIAWQRLFHYRASWLVGDYFTQRGVNASEDLRGMRPLLFPSALWVLITLAAIAAGIVLCGLLAEWVGVRLSRRQPGDPIRQMLALQVVLTLGAMAAATVINSTVFDRYTWIVAVSGGLLLLGYREAPASPPAPAPAAVPAGVPAGAPRAAGVATVCAMGALALVTAANSAAFDGARWRAGRRLVAEGLPAQSVDAGFEWTGAHATGVAHVHGVFDAIDGTGDWRLWFPGEPTCALVASSPIHVAGYVPAGAESWNLLLLGVPEQLYLYRNTAAACGTVPT